MVAPPGIFRTIMIGFPGSLTGKYRVKRRAATSPDDPAAPVVTSTMVLPAKETGLEDGEAVGEVVGLLVGTGLEVGLAVAVGLEVT